MRYRAGARPRSTVQATGAILNHRIAVVDAWRMSTRLRRTIDSGEYRVDPDAVADAMLRHLRADAPIPLGPSTVLVPVDLFEDLTPGSHERHVLALDDCA